ncbi:hypothetical protein PLICRDRAFT_265899 [Plicaturopsis crispa FD-325 SS-3]|nr:hypothetical protein PLICRDRAFT_265899 [Plicaturopsis crispa FD-325 SS-3]
MDSDTGDTSDLDFDSMRNVLLPLDLYKHSLFPSESSFTRLLQLFRNAFATDRTLRFSKDLLFAICDTLCCDTRLAWQVALPAVLRRVCQWRLLPVEAKGDALEQLALDLAGLVDSRGLGLDREVPEFPPRLRVRWIRPKSDAEEETLTPLPVPTARLNSPRKSQSSPDHVCQDVRHHEYVQFRSGCCACRQRRPRTLTHYGSATFGREAADVQTVAEPVPVPPSDAPVEVTDIFYAGSPDGTLTADSVPITSDVAPVHEAPPPPSVKTPHRRNVSTGAVARSKGTPATPYRAPAAKRPCDENVPPSTAKPARPPRTSNRIPPVPALPSLISSQSAKTPATRASASRVTARTSTSAPSTAPLSASRARPASSIKAKRESHPTAPGDRVRAQPRGKTGPDSATVSTSLKKRASLSASTSSKPPPAKAAAGAGARSVPVPPTRVLRPRKPPMK